MLRLLFFIAAVIIGNKNLPSELILKKIGNPPYSQESIEKLLNLYKDKGFIQAKVIVQGDTLKIQEGVCFRVGNIKLQGNESLTEKEILLDFKTKEGKIFNESEFEEDIDNLLTRYENIGYPFVKIEPFDFSLDSARVNFGLKINEGPLAKIGEIEVAGNKITKDYVIVREMRLNKGAMFSQKNIENGKKSIEKLGFFSVEDIELKGLPGDPEKIGIIIKVKENITNQLLGILGYRRGRVSGLLDIRIPNLFGTGRSITFRLEKPSPLTSSLNLSYNEPWILGFPVNGILEISNRQEPDYILTKAAATLDAPILTYLSMQAGLTFRKVLANEEYKVFLGVQLDTRSPPFFAIRGTRLVLASEYDLQGLTRIKINLDNFMPLSTNYGLFFSINGGQILEDTGFVYDSLRVGGAKTLRGYDEDEFRGTRVAWANFEFSRLLGGITSAFIFQDIGYINDSWKTGFGLGITAESKIGIIKLTYGLARGRSLDEGKIHIEVLSTF
jgi:outer membrane protein insertion porin family